MNAFVNLPTRTKLVISFSLVIALLGIVVATAYFGLDSTERMERSLVTVGELKAGTNGQRAAMLTAILAPDLAMKESLLSDAAAYTSTRQAHFTFLTEMHGDDPDLGPSIRVLSSLLDELDHTREQAVMPAIKASKTEEATALVLGVQRERYEKIRAIERNFTEIIRSRIESRLLWTRAMLGIASAIAILAALGLVTLLTRLIAQPLAEITAVADRIAQGDLNNTLLVDQRHDEVGVLREAFRRMTRSLSDLAGRARDIASGDLTARIQPQSQQDVLGTAFASMTENLRDVIGEVINAADVLNSSTGEISAATMQIAASAAETATAVTQTTATVAEVKQATRTSSEIAGHVSAQSQKVADVSRLGRASVDDVVTGMTRIRGHMDSIASSILRLNAQGQTIGEIITTVDDLAGQSKMLAINASMEAAKAGTEGKGFAVVAQEVKNLAEQSRLATARVRTILHEIEKATSAAVLTTEEGSKAVDAGLRESSAAGDSIAALSESVAESAHSSSQIAVTSQQQSTGMDQVSLAMGSIQAACTKTAEGARQAEAEAQRLVGLGKKLTKLVAAFKV